jgi:hypothetical protein
MRKLKYSKGTGNLYLEPSVQVSQPEEEAPVSFTHTSTPLSYTKGDGEVSCRIVCVISGGTDRERALLNEVERKKTFTQLQVIFVSSKTAPLPQGGLTPNMMKKVYDGVVESGVISLNDDHEIHLQDIDKIYLFTDVDHYYHELQELMSHATPQEKEDWIISNPDIEIWIYYCYRNNPEEELKEVLEAPESARSSMLKNVNGRFNKGGGLDTRKTFACLPSGIQHARSHYAEDASGIPCLFSTQMYRFAEDVIQSLGDEYLQWQERVRLRNIRYKTAVPCNSFTSL